MSIGNVLKSSQNVLNAFHNIKSDLINPRIHGHTIFFNYNTSSNNRLQCIALGLRITKTTRKQVRCEMHWESDGHDRYCDIKTTVMFQIKVVLNNVMTFQDGTDVDSTDRSTTSLLDFLCLLPAQDTQ